MALYLLVGVSGSHVLYALSLGPSLKDSLRTTRHSYMDGRVHHQLVSLRQFSAVCFPAERFPFTAQSKIASTHPTYIDGAA